MVTFLEVDEQIWIVKVTRVCVCERPEWVLVEVNSSLSEGIILLPFTEALVFSLFKKPLLDASILDNFHPKINLSFLERWLRRWLCNNFKKPWWSQLPISFSIKIKTQMWDKNSIGCTLDDSWYVRWGCVSILAIFDLSAACDTIKHDIFDWLGGLGMGGIVLCWIASFFQGWFSQWWLRRGPALNPNCGMPQVLSSLLFGSPLFTLRTLDGVVEFHRFIRVCISNK